MHGKKGRTVEPPPFSPPGPCMRAQASGLSCGVLVRKPKQWGSGGARETADPERLHCIYITETCKSRPLGLFLGYVVRRNGMVEQVQELYTEHACNRRRSLAALIPRLRNALSVQGGSEVEQAKS